MADHSSAILQKMVDLRGSQSKAAMGLFHSMVDDANKPSSSKNRELKSMDSTRIRGADIINTNQEHKKRCFEKLVVRTERTTNENVKDVKRSLQVEVIDDTALIETTAAVSGFKKSYKKETEVGSVNLGGSKNLKQEKDGKKRRNRGSKKQGKQGKESSVKFVKDRKNVQVGNEKKIPDRKGQNGFRKPYPKTKAVYRRKEKQDAIDVQEHQKVETEIAPEKIIDGSSQEPDLNPNASDETEEETIVNLVETEPVIEKGDGLESNPKKKEEEEDQNVGEITNGDEKGVKKLAYTKEEIEALRFVNEDEQMKKWTKIYDGFSPTVAKEYTSLLSDMNKSQPQRYNRVINGGSTSTSTFNRHAILSMPPVLPMCSSSSYKKDCELWECGFQGEFP